MNPKSLLTPAPSCFCGGEGGGIVAFAMALGFNVRNWFRETLTPSPSPIRWEKVGRKRVQGHDDGRTLRAFGRVAPHANAARKRHAQQRVGHVVSRDEFIGEAAQDFRCEGDFEF